MRRHIGLPHARRLVHHAFRKHLAQDSVHHVVQPPRVDLAVGDGIDQRCAEIFLAIETARRFLVEPGVHRRHRRGNRSPVRQDPAGKMPVALQYLVEKKIILAGIGAVDTIVGAHDRAGFAAFDREFEGEQIRFPCRLLADIGAQHHAAVFLIVEREMFDRGNHMRALDACDFGTRHGSGEQRIFARIFEGAAAARFAREIHGAGEHDVVGTVARLVADDAPRRERQRRIPGRRHCKA